jgi:hypothetical protein
MSFQQRCTHCGTRLTRQNQETLILYREEDLIGVFTELTRRCNDDAARIW